MAPSFVRGGVQKGENGGKEGPHLKSFFEAQTEVQCDEDCLSMMANRQLETQMSG